MAPLPLHCYEVHTADDPRAVSQIRVPSDFMQHAMRICAEQKELIATKIAADRIPFPAAISRERLKVVFDARRVGASSAVPATDPVLLFEEEDHSDTCGGLPRRRRGLGLYDLGVLAGRIADVAKPGPIVIVTRKPEALLLRCLLWLQGRGSLCKAPGYGEGDDFAPRYLLRPACDTFIRWICYDEDCLARVGAIVFLGDANVEAEVEALAAAHHKPPVVVASETETGRLEISAIYPHGIRHDRSTDGRPVRISIVIVSFNQASYLEEAIRSVVTQNDPDLEIVVVDGGSTDGSVEIIEAYRKHFTHVIIEPDDGQSDALGKGFARATGEVMNWLCSDDLLEPGALARVRQAYLTSGADVIVGGCVRIGELRSAELIRHHTALVVGRKVRLDPADLLDYMRSWHVGNYFYQPEVFFSRRIWEAAGGFIKKHLHYAMDYDLWLRMALAGASVYHIPAMIGCSRVHPGQKTRPSMEYLHAIRQLFEEYEDFFAALVAADRVAERHFPRLWQGGGCQ